MPAASEPSADARFVERAIDFAATHALKTEPQSDEDYLVDLVPMAARARRRGDYGIAASVVLRSGGTEVVCAASNAVVTEADAAGHAEVRALFRARAAVIAAAEGRRLRDAVPAALVRPAPHAGSEIVLYTSLEPCPMCAVAALGAGVTRVVIAHPDPRGGALLWPDRLPEHFAHALRDRLVVDVCQHETAGPAYASAELLSLLAAAYEPTQGRVMAATRGRGLLPPAAIAGAHRAKG